MARELRGNQKHHVVILMLLVVRWNPVQPAPINERCERHFENTYNQTKLLHHKATELLQKYIKNLGVITGPVPDEVPSAIVTGANISEKLQDIYTKNQLFQLHLSQVGKYLKKLLNNPTPVMERLTDVKNTLLHNLHNIKEMLTEFTDPPTPVPTPPETPEPSHGNDYSKKVYGWGVILGLTQWVEKVLPVLKDAKAICGKR